MDVLGITAPPLLGAAALAAFVFLLLLAWATARAVRQDRLVRAMLRAGLTLPALFASLLLFTILLGTQGYRSLTQEALAATVHVRPAGAPQTFEAYFVFPDGREARYTLQGDELYVDAHILKWKYWANVLGLHTNYQLDRVAGRYRNLADEQTKGRTVHNLARTPLVDIFEWRQQYGALAPLMDAEYGSATFVAGHRPAVYEIRVSTTGLLARRLP